MTGRRGLTWALAGLVGLAALITIWAVLAELEMVAVGPSRKATIRSSVGDPGVRPSPRAASDETRMEGPDKAGSRRNIAPSTTS